MIPRPLFSCGPYAVIQPNNLDCYVRMNLPLSAFLHRKIDCAPVRRA
jgi:hypothetical protein